MATYQSNPVLFAVSVLVALMTSFYMFRLLFIVFWGKPSVAENPHHPVHESPKIMTIPIMVLAFLSIAGGFIGVPHLLGGSDRIQHYLAPIFADSRSVLESAAGDVGHLLELVLMLVPLVLIVLVIYAAYHKFVVKRDLVQSEKELSGFRNLIAKKYYIDEHYEWAIQKPIVWLSGFLHDVVEVKWLDKLINNTGNFVVWAGKNIRYIQTGNVGVYLFLMVVSIILILFLNLYT
jgi:NADH-quinone oxidoreductase subunit L